MNKTLLKQYIDSGYSSYKIANISNKGQTTIRYWLKKYNLFTKGNKRYTKIINGDTHIKCGNCDKFYSKDNFYKKTKKSFMSYCKECFNEYAKERWKARKRKAIEYKGGKCSSCGYNKYPDVLEFHHRDAETKELKDFYKKSNKVYSSCKECFNSYCINRWKERKKKAVEYKGGKCSSCGYNKYPDVLEFHHRDPNEKEFDWKKLRKRNWEAVLKELDKCDMLCANCHRERHYEIFSQK